MPFYLKHLPYATWHVYLVEAQDEDKARTCKRGLLYDNLASKKPGPVHKVCDEAEQTSEEKNKLESDSSENL